VLKEVDEEVHGAVEVGTVDHTVVSVRISHRCDDVQRGGTGAGFLHLGRVVAVALDEVELEGDAVGFSGVLDEADEFAVRDGAGVVEKDAGAAAEVSLGLFRVASLVVGDAALEGQAEIWADEVGSRTSAAKANFFLGGGDEEDLVAVGKLHQTLHGFEQDRAADAVIPRLPEVVVAGEDLERRIGHDGVTGFDAKGRDFGGGAGTSVEEDAVAWDDGGAFGGGNDVNVSDAGDGFYGTFAAEDDPPLVDEGLVEPAAEHLHGELAVGRDAADHAAELVHVGVDHNPGAGGAELCDDAPHAVVAQRCDGQRLHRGDHDGAHRILVPRRAGGVGEPLQELDSGVGLLGRKKRRGG